MDLKEYKAYRGFLILLVIIGIVTAIPAILFILLFSLLRWDWRVFDQCAAMVATAISKAVIKEL